MTAFKHPKLAPVVTLAESVIHVIIMNTSNAKKTICTKGNYEENCSKHLKNIFPHALGL